MSRTRFAFLILLVVGLSLLYVAGIGVRGRYGIRVVVRNGTGKPLREVKLNVETRGRRYTVGEIPVGHSRSIFVHPVTESHVDLAFIGQDGLNHVKTVVGYAEQGYCGRADIAILADDRIDVTDRVKLDCWESWFGFI